MSVLLLALLILVSLASGAGDVGWGEMWAWLMGSDADAYSAAVLGELRLARIVLAIVVGIGLAQGGVVFQAVLQNPLAEPYLLGISGGAVLGALLASHTGLAGPYAFVPSFLGAFIASTVVFTLGAGLKRPGGFGVVLLLAGVMVNTLCSAALVLLLALFGETSGAAVFFWLLGDLGRSDLAGAMLLAGLSAPLWLLIALFAYRLNLHGLGEKQAGLWGLPVRRERWLLLIGASLLAALSVAQAGLIGFIGLMAPHLARALSGPDQRRLLPLAMLLGAILLLGADTAARTLFAPLELPVGVFTAFLGVPFFLFWLLRREHVT